jgi:hypothetical protein
LTTLSRTALVAAAVILCCPTTYSKSALAQHANAVVPLTPNLGPHSAPLPPVAYYDRTKDPSSDRVPTSSRKELDFRRQDDYKSITDPGLSDNGREHDLTTRVVDYMDGGDALPVSHSTAIVVGTLLASHGFVAEDHTSVYSEHQFSVGQVLKSDDPALVSGTTIVGTRLGGSVHFPSGHIRDYIIKGEGVPTVGVKYLLFLWRPSDVHSLDYGIDTAYELGADGKVYALDFEQPYTRYEGAEQADVFAAISQTVAAR